MFTVKRITGGLIRKLVPLAVLTLATTFVLAGCGSGTSGGNASSSNDKNTLVVAMPSDEATLDPGVSMDNAAWKITYPCYERLVQYKGNTTSVIPSLAEKWDVSTDGKTWTFTLKSGDAFPDGTPVDANAVKFSFDRLLKLNKGPAGGFDELQQVNAPNPSTVQFVLKFPFAPFLSSLACNYASIIDPKVMDHQVNDDMGQSYLSEHTMGSGPYQLAEWLKGQYLHLTLNPKYDGPKPALTNVFFRIISDASAQRLQLEKGSIDIAEGIPSEQITQMKNDSGVTVINDPSLFVDYLYINCSKGNAALKNKLVRQAISYAVDYQGIIQASQSGYATQMRGPVPQGLWGYDKDAFQYSHNPDKAKELLSQAGVKGLTLTLLYSDHFAWWPSEGLAIQNDLQQVGINVKLEKVEYATERDMLDKGQFDLALGIWSPDYADPYMFMNLWFDSNNFGLAGNRAFYKNPQIDQLIRQAVTITDQNQREQLYNQAQKIVVDEAPYVYLYQRNYLLPIRSNVKGFVYNPMLEQIYNLPDMSKE